MPNIESTLMSTMRVSRLPDRSTAFESTSPSCAPFRNILTEFGASTVAGGYWQRKFTKASSHLAIRRCHGTTTSSNPTEITLTPSRRRASKFSSNDSLPEPLASRGTISTFNPAIPPEAFTFSAPSSMPLSASRAAAAFSPVSGSIAPIG